MARRTRSIACYFLSCLFLFVAVELFPSPIVDKFYRLDRHHIYIVSYYVALLIVGVLLRVHSATSLKRAVVLGGLNGLICGLIAQGVVPTIGAGSVLRLENVSELVFSIAVGSLVL